MPDNGVKIAIIIEELLYDYILVISFEKKKKKRETTLLTGDERVFLYGIHFILLPQATKQ